MDDLKQSVQNAVYEQKDPLLIYKFEAFEMFKRFIGKLNEDVIPSWPNRNYRDRTPIKSVQLRPSGHKSPKCKRRKRMLEARLEEETEPL